MEAKRADASSERVYGRVLESAYHAGLSAERTMAAFEYLLDEDRWRTVEPGFDDINDFLAEFEGHFSQIKFPVTQRQSIARKLKALQASQRKTAAALGVSQPTIHNDVTPDKKLSPKPEEPSHTPPSDTLADKDLSPEPEPWFEESAESTVEKLKDTQPPAKPHVSNNSGENEWYTPPRFLDAARDVLGTIDLDPASSDIANQTVQAVNYFTKDNDGLAQPWKGRVWMNPPYASELIGKFCGKLCDSYAVGDVSEAIVLVNNGTETSWWKRLAEHATATCFPDGRVQFLDPQGNPGAPLQGQAILYLGHDATAFVESFKSIGDTWVRA